MSALADLVRDRNDVLRRRMEEVVDGDYEGHSTMAGPEVREHWVQRPRPEDRDELSEIMLVQRWPSTTRGGKARRSSNESPRRPLPRAAPAPR